jgi:hypothetical protein
MKRFGFAAVLIALLGSSVGAQPPNLTPTPIPPNTPAPTTSTAFPEQPALPGGNYSYIGSSKYTGVLPGPLPVMPAPWYPSPTGPIPSFVPPPPTYTGPAGPAIPVDKTGGLVVGFTGYYPYDSGHWLLGGNDGLVRQTGPYTMVFPGGNNPPDPSSYLPAAAPCERKGLFKHGLGLFCH